MTSKKGRVRFAILFCCCASTILLFQNCGGKFTPLHSSASTQGIYGGGAGVASLSWAANRETAVNSSGGGYRVYYTQKASVDTDAPYVEVSYSSGAQAPTTVRLTGLISGTYHASIMAYSSLKPAANPLSEPITFTIK